MSVGVGRLRVSVRVRVTKRGDFVEQTQTRRHERYFSNQIHKTKRERGRATGRERDAVQEKEHSLDQRPNERR